MHILNGLTLLVKYKTKINIWRLWINIVCCACTVDRPSALLLLLGWLIWSCEENADTTGSEAASSRVGYSFLRSIFLRFVFISNFKFLSCFPYTELVFFGRTTSGSRFKVYITEHCLVQNIMLLIKQCFAAKQKSESGRLLINKMQFCSNKTLDFGGTYYCAANVSLEMFVGIKYRNSYWFPLWCVHKLSRVRYWFLQILLQCKLSP